MKPMLRPILIHPNPKLKKVCEPVLEIDDALIELSDDMLETMYHAPGIGLAAPQIGVLNRIIVMDCEKDDAANRKPIVMINPEIVYSSDEESTYEEGCLSIPEQFAGD
jgi:peptide deformylase